MQVIHNMHVIRSTITVGLLMAAALLGNPEAAAAQYKLDSPSGEELVFERDQVREMLDTTRALFQNLVEDPAVMYGTGVGTSVPEDNPTDAYPWNAIEVRNDSIAVIQTPNNLREADRAYYNYAVLRMAEVRSGDPDASCDVLMDAEVRVVSSFVDGWIVARMLFGGPSFEPLDRLAFIRAAGHLAAFVALNEDPSLGVCAGEWADEHAADVAAYRSWSAAAYRSDVAQSDTGQPDATQPDAGQPDAGPPDEGQSDADQPDATQPDAEPTEGARSAASAGEEAGESGTAGSPD